MQKIIEALDLLSEDITKISRHDPLFNDFKNVEILNKPEEHKTTPQGLIIAMGNLDRLIEALSNLQCSFNYMVDDYTKEIKGNILMVEKFKAYVVKRMNRQITESDKAALPIIEEAKETQQPFSSLLQNYTKSVFIY